MEGRGGRGKLRASPSCEPTPPVRTPIYFRDLLHVPPLASLRSQMAQEWCVMYGVLPVDEVWVCLHMRISPVRYTVMSLLCYARKVDARARE